MREDATRGGIKGRSVMTPVIRLALGSLLIAALVLCLKFAAYWITGSVALFSDALESVVNVASAIAVILAVKWAAVPADGNHPYGHHKAELVSAILEGVLIILAAIFILQSAYFAFDNPQEVLSVDVGLGLNLLAGVINGVWCWILLKRGRMLRSPALIADGKHLRSDVISSFGVVIGVSLAYLTGYWILDPIIAVLVALQILWSGGHLIKDSLGGLMDEAAPDELLDKVVTVISNAGGGALQAHDLRTRQAGQVTFVEFHLVVPGDMLVRDAHDLCDKIELALEREIPNVRPHIHVEPQSKAEQDAIDIT